MNKVLETISMCLKYLGDFQSDLISGITYRAESKKMERKLICVVFLMLFVASMVEAASPPTRLQRVGKRNSKGLIKKREYCARARMICSPEADDFNDEADLMNLNIEEN
ncbi:hypothetical protein ACROYT_G041470 [Oculina patagonica]